MASGLIIDRLVECGLPGKHASFNLAHGWATGAPQEEPESKHVHHYGFRESVDHLKLVPYQEKFPDLTLERWPTKAQKIKRTCEGLFERIQEKLLTQIYMGGREPVTVFADVENQIAQLQADPFGETGAYNAPDLVDWCTGDRKMVKELIEDQNFRDAWINAVGQVKNMLPEWFNHWRRMYFEDFQKYLESRFESLPEKTKDRIREAFESKYGSIVAFDKAAWQEGQRDVESWIRYPYDIPQFIVGYGKFAVDFVHSREGTPMATVHHRIAYPERSGKQPEVGEIWEVEIAGSNPKGTVYFLRLIRKLGTKRKD